MNASANVHLKNILVNGVSKLGKNASLTVLKSDNLEDVNSLAHPDHVKPHEQKIKIKGNKLKLPLAPFSFTVLPVKLS